VLGGEIIDGTEGFEIMDKLAELRDQTHKNEPETIYAEMDPDNPDVMIVESMCPNCNKNGETRMTFMRLNQHKEQIISSFSCPHCDYSNTHVESGTELASNGMKITLNVEMVEDLNRQIIKTDGAIFEIPEIELTIPAKTQEGLTTTVEGIVQRTITQLSSEQPVRKHMDPESYEAIEKFITKCTQLIDSNLSKDGILDTKFTCIIDDPSGLSSIEPASGSVSLANDPRVSVEFYERTREQAESLGFFKEQTKMADIPSELRPENNTTNTEDDEFEAGEFLPAVCSSCGYEDAKQRFCEVDIPGFRRCLIMAFTCGRCGFKDSEVKPSGDIGDKGKRWFLTVKYPQDLDRDILKSTFAEIKIRDIRKNIDKSMEIPSVDLQAGTLGSLFTTIEGLCIKASENLSTSMPFHGDSTEDGNYRALVWGKLVEGLKLFGSGELLDDGSLKYPFTLEVIDLADHSFIGERGETFVGEKGRLDYRSGNNDESLVVETFERTDEQNDELGLTEMMKQEKLQNATPDTVDC